VVSGQVQALAALILEKSLSVFVDEEDLGVAEPV
jgi:hypothetical protein